MNKYALKIVVHLSQLYIKKTVADSVVRDPCELIPSASVSLHQALEKSTGNAVTASPDIQHHLSWLPTYRVKRANMTINFSLERPLAAANAKRRLISTRPFGRQNGQESSNSATQSKNKWENANKNGQKCKVRSQKQRGSLSVRAVRDFTLVDDDVVRLRFMAFFLAVHSKELFCHAANIPVTYRLDV